MSHKVPWIWIAIATCSVGAIAQDEIAANGTPDNCSLELKLTPQPCFELRGCDFTSTAQAQDSFSVTAKIPDLEQPPRIMGKYEIVEGGVNFTPRFPLSRKLEYQVHFNKRLESLFPPSQKRTFALPNVASVPSAKVEAIYPTADSLPANLLKFYIHFSQPMSRGDAYKHITLLQDNEPVIGAFLELGEELWNSDQTRFTLFIHPGRIKRGLAPREQQGPAISTGKQYTLQIASSWQDAEGTPLVTSHSKSFSVVDEDHEQPNIELWKIDTPKRNTRAPVGLTFGEALDHGMLNRVFVVQDQFGEVIEGEIAVAHSETQWLFTPSLDWRVGTYNIVVAANLEDLCGNSIARPFEVKMQKKVAAKSSTKVAIEFIVK